jgi:hypothetical protein
VKAHTHILLFLSQFKTTQLCTLLLHADSPDTMKKNDEGRIIVLKVILLVRLKTQ